MTTRQPEALRLAEILECGYSLAWLYERGGYEVSAELRRQHARITDLEARLEAIGAGGVSGPLIGQPQAMPDLSQLTERGAKAWAGVDAQGLREGGADMSKERDDLTAFYAWLHTYESEVGALDDGSARVGFIAGRASLQPPGFTAADMATVSAQGFRDGVASVSAQAADSVLEDAARWNEVLRHVGAAYHLGGQHFTLNTLRIRDQMYLLRGSVAQHFTACIDDSRAARKQGASQ